VRLRALILLALPIAVACVGCGQSQPLAAWPPMGVVGHWSSPGWDAIAEGLRPHTDPATSNVCTAGAPACMDDVVAEMTQRLDRLASSCSDLAPFALMYRQVSNEVRGSVRARRYQSPAYVAHLDSVFATLYFRALDEWRLGHRDQVPRPWRIAFSSAVSHRVSALGDLLLGMNAHISRDLPYSLAAVGLHLPDGRDGVPDVLAVNRDIALSQGRALAGVALRFDPTVRHTDQFGGPDEPGHIGELKLGKIGDPRQIGKVIAAWRREAVDNARRLLAARTHAERLRVDTTIDAHATLRALLIADATAYRSPKRDAEARLRYCQAAHHRI
jgi:Family of unknown function (DUF5995)